jgi:hypothetical protein
MLFELVCCRTSRGYVGQKVRYFVVGCRRGLED